MAWTKTKKTVVAIVPAFNEAERIGAVLNILKKVKVIDNIIVVDDGSTDNTTEVAKKYKVKVIRNKINLGKALAMDKAVKTSKADIIFFSDADLKGLTPEIIEDIIKPVFEGKLEMFAAIRDRKIYKIIGTKFIPHVGGERALTRKLWGQIPMRYMHKYRIEPALNFYARKYKGFRFKAYPMGQIIKEKKYGILSGFRRRIITLCSIAYGYILLFVYRK